MTNYEMVREFHQKFGADLDTNMREDNIKLRRKLIEEEYKEVGQELYEAEEDLIASGYVTNQVKVAMLKELCDLLYVVYGTAASYGMNIDEAFKEVHRSNMSKLGPDGKPIKRHDGKVLKSDAYTPADVRGFI